MHVRHVDAVVMSAKPQVLLLFLDRFVERFGRTVNSLALTSLDGRRAPFNRLRRQLSSEESA
jgi:hypothetical protein